MRSSPFLVPKDEYTCFHLFIPISDALATDRSIRRGTAVPCPYAFCTGVALPCPRADLSHSQIKLVSTLTDKTLAMSCPHKPEKKTLEHDRLHLVSL